MSFLDFNIKFAFVNFLDSINFLESAFVMRLADRAWARLALIAAFRAS